jgi:pimeloyl-ACP methyl ester carboxylesterase
MREVEIRVRNATLAGNLAVPGQARGLVLFAHGSGSSRHSPRNVFVARALEEARIATLLMDLLTPAEEAVDMRTREHRFDIGLLADRLAQATAWVDTQPGLARIAIGYFGASTGSAAALIAAAALGDRIAAVVSRGGRPDLAGAALTRVTAPTLLIVGGEDHGVIELNEQAHRVLRCEKELVIVPGATHLFEEPGTLERVAELARDWLVRRFDAPRDRAAAGDPSHAVS